MKICIIELKLRNFRSPILNSCKSVICFFQEYNTVTTILDTIVRFQTLVFYVRYQCPILDTIVLFQTPVSDSRHYYSIFGHQCQILGTIVLFTTLVSDSRAQRSNLDTSVRFQILVSSILDTRVIFQTLVCYFRLQCQILDTSFNFQTFLFQTLVSDSRLVFSFRH